jgi:nitrite reductase/ring-hydroxylating ferredoxin subunit
VTDTESELDSATAEELSEPMTIGVDAYISEDYARAERDKLWRKVWQQVGRVEEIPEVGGYLTCDILDDSIIVVRTGPNESGDDFSAHHNVCMHRGRRLVDTPEGAKNACGRARKSFVCGFHGWTYGLDGACTHIREQDDWKGALTPQNTHLAPVRVEGFHLGPAATGPRHDVVEPVSVEVPRGHEYAAACILAQPAAAVADLGSCEGRAVASVDHAARLGASPGTT